MIDSKGTYSGSKRRMAQQPIEGGTGQSPLSRHALLIVFGDIEFGAQKISGDTIYEYLTSRDVWFVPRLPRGAEPGMAILFYQSGVGFRGSAVVANVTSTSGVDSKQFGLVPLDLYPIKISLSSLRTFHAALDPRPLLEQLSFVANKTYWGHSFRYSPRLIPIADFERVTRAQKPDL